MKALVPADPPPVLKRQESLLAKGGPWLQRVGGFRLVPDLVRQLGGDAPALLRSVGIDAAALDDPQRSLPFGAVVRLLHQAAERTGCEHFGLLAGRTWHLADLGLVGQLMANARSVGEALQVLTVYQHLNSTGGMAFLIQRGTMVEFGYAIYHPGIANTAQMYDAVLAGGANFMRDLCGPGWVPSEVLLSHAKPSDVSHHRNLFKVLPRFNSEVSCLRFPASCLDRPVEGSSAERLRIALAEARRTGRGNLVQQVCRALRLLLLQGRNSGDEVAQMLSMHRRTLNRRLKQEGTTFQAALDQIRFELARELLADPGIALDDVAAALGYAGVSPFMRTFRRWTGTTPGKWRRNAGVPEPASRAASPAMGL